MPSPRQNWRWLLVALVVALVVAMAITLIGLSRGTIRSRHGVHGAAPVSTPLPLVCAVAPDL